MSVFDTIARLSIFTPDSLTAHFLENYPEDSELSDVAIDCETSGLEYPAAELRSAQLYFPHTKVAVYVKLGPEAADGVMSYADFAAVLNEFAPTTTFYYYNASFDLRFLIREGVIFYEIRDGAIINTALQHGTLKLKHLVAELGLVPFSEIMTWTKLVQLAKDRGFVRQDAGDDIDFELLEKNLPEAIDYALDDPVYTWLVYQPLYDQYVTNFANPQECDTVLRWQFDTQLLLAHSEAEGYEIDLPQLEHAVELKGIEYDAEEESIRQECKSILGWIEPIPVEPKPISLQGSLLDLLDETTPAGDRA